MRFLARSSAARARTPVVGIDGLPDGLAASVFQDPKAQSAKAIDVALKMIKGDPLRLKSGCRSNGSPRTRSSRMSSALNRNPVPNAQLSAKGKLCYQWHMPGRSRLCRLPGWFKQRQICPPPITFDRLGTVK